MPGSHDRNLTCPNGHTFGADELATLDDKSRCPECGVGFSSSSDKPSSGSARSLWEVMGRSSGGEVSESASTSELSLSGELNLSGKADMPAADSDDASPETEQSESNRPETAERPRGLWAMMDAAQPLSETSEETAGADSSESFEEASSNDSDLFGPETKTGGTDESVFRDDESDDEFELADDDEEDGWEVDAPLHDLDAADPSRFTDDSAADCERLPKFPRGTVASMAGILSVLLCGLNLLPAMAAKFPATIVGGYALFLGYQTFGSNRRRRESAPQLRASLGMFLGLIGIFAGPAYLNELGESWRNRSAKQVIESNLGSIHQALNDYASEKGHFPAGGTFTVDDEGLEVGMHSWMTSLLPYLGHREVYESIDQSKPWIDAVNATPMSRPIPTFLTPATQHELTARGHATTHFAGVGGIIQTELGLLPTGLFEKNSAIRIDEVTDGMSQTIIAGEIARAIPAWGDPENWRTIEGPLNKRLSSFGNVAGTGAHFLQGDGSVRFFSNKTSPEVLQRLATRNASD
jgi:hypothetical protein